jgi:hypothetical protein
MEPRGGRYQGRGRVVHLGTLLRDGVLVLLLLASRATAASHGRRWLVGLVDDKARVALFWIPLEASQVRLLELVICLYMEVSLLPERAWMRDATCNSVGYNGTSRV